VTPYTVEFARSADRELERLPAPAGRRILEAIRALQVNPRPPGSKKLVGSETTYRIRVGQYRVVYEIDDRARAVLITRIRHRREAYQ
jgi:mRNA interferase RelE/StbE